MEMGVSKEVIKVIRSQGWDLIHFIGRERETLERFAGSVAMCVCARTSTHQGEELRRNPASPHLDCRRPAPNHEETDVCCLCCPGWVMALAAPADSGGHLLAWHSAWWGMLT